MDLPEPKFKALISEYLLILGSKYIDDESLYLKHLQKQSKPSFKTPTLSNLTPSPRTSSPKSPT